MCFSAEADLVAGIAVSAVGIDAIRRARTPIERPLAALPLVFGAHQLIETFVWWGLRGHVPAALGHTATWIYLFIAFGLPLLVPLAVHGVEPRRDRRTLMGLLTALGAAVSLVLWFALIRGPVDAAIEGYHIVYIVGVPGGVLTGLLYAVTACGALMLASDRWIRFFGVSNLVAVAVLVWLSVGGLKSLWCVWAAITSVAIDLYLRDEDRQAGRIAA
jgi:Family of unknown function (DUF6629)